MRGTIDYKDPMDNDYDDFFDRYTFQDRMTWFNEK